MEGPYRDLGSGFARLGGAEGLRRTPSRISSVENALLELLRNSYEAGARNIYVASTLSKRRYRTLLVLDDGSGIPDPYKDLIFEPGVTNRHLPLKPHPQNQSNPSTTSESSGLSLYHISEKAEKAAVFSTSNPTAVKTTFDTEKLPESTLQSPSRASKSNLEATAKSFLSNVHAHTNNHPKIQVYISSPARVLAAMLKNRIIPEGSIKNLSRSCEKLGLDLSERTLQRVRRRDIQPADPVLASEQIGVVDKLGAGSQVDKKAGKKPDRIVSGSITLDREERSEIFAVLSRAARKSYLEVGEIQVESRADKIHLSARLYEPEDEYE